MFLLVLPFGNVVENVLIISKTWSFFLISRQKEESFVVFDLIFKFRALKTIMMMSHAYSHQRAVCSSWQLCLCWVHFHDEYHCDYNLQNAGHVKIGKIFTNSTIGVRLKSSLLKS